IRRRASFDALRLLRMRGILIPPHPERLRSYCSVARFSRMAPGFCGARCDVRCGMGVCSCRLGGGSAQAEQALKVVGERVPEEDDARLGAPAHGETGEAVATHHRVDALGEAA